MPTVQPSRIAKPDGSFAISSLNSSCQEKDGVAEPLSAFYFGRAAGSAARLTGETHQPSVILSSKSMILSENFGYSPATAQVAAGSDTGSGHRGGPSAHLSLMRGGGAMHRRCNTWRERRRIRVARQSWAVQLPSHREFF
jgi:hypothetical protein